MNIVFFGTDENSLLVLKGLIRAKQNILMVVTSQKEVRARGNTRSSSLVKEYCDKNNIINLTNFDYAEHKPDIIIVASYGSLIPCDALSIPKYGALNIHPSSLPKYRGPSPVRTALLNGDPETGVSIISLNSKMDSGPIINQEVVKVDEQETCETLTKKLFEIGLHNLLNVLKEPGVIFHAKEQDDTKATYTKKFHKTDGIIDWNLSAEKIFCKFRAMGQDPGSYTFLNNKKLIICSASFEKENRKELAIGQLGKTNQEGKALPIVQAKKGIIILKSLKPQNKNEMSGEDFLNGYYSDIGQILG